MGKRHSRFVLEFMCDFNCETFLCIGISLSFEFEGFNCVGGLRSVGAPKARSALAGPSSVVKRRRTSATDGAAGHGTGRGGVDGLMFIKSSLSRKKSAPLPSGAFSQKGGRPQGALVYMCFSWHRVDGMNSLGTKSTL